jgi:rhamnosyltransferase
MNLKVAAYITAYLDAPAVASCISAIKQQTYSVEQIFIVDNSPLPLTLTVDRTDAIIASHAENIGISGGLQLALEWAITHDYDFLWTFDQDSVPTANCLETLLEAYKEISQNNYLIGIIAPTAIDSRTNLVVEGAVFESDRFVGKKHENYVPFYECDAPITSGSLISIAAAKRIELPGLDLFIDGVDFDYGLRFKRQGFHNLIIPQAILYHRFGEPVKVKFLSKERFVHQYSALRHYYICRNHTYLDTRCTQSWYYRLTSYLWRIKFMRNTIIFILLYDDGAKLQKVWACLLGTFHGLQGRIGKTW